MTGSGKSEFIITYILSMAVNYHPDEVAFILIDYKGGGLAGAFENKKKGIKLPHLAGTITNLDGASINRSLVSIQSELRKRQSIFNEAKQISNEGTMDIYKYQKLYREGIVTEPVPHLFIISDEFAELKTQQPDFMDQLISTARIGRSLGVHLILATQKPNGVVNDQIWSNSRFRVCLKVQEKQDSMDMIKRPDAAELSATGRFYLQVGYNEFFDIGQSAWCGAPYVPTEEVESKEEDSVQIIDNLGRIVKEVKDSKKENEENVNNIKQIVGIVNYLSEIADEDNISVRKLWMDEIPEFITVNSLINKYGPLSKDSPEVVIGEYDDPFNQQQNIVVHNVLECGNTIIYGATGSGKELLVNTLVCGLIENYTPSDINLFLIDFGSEALQMYAKAPHVGNVLLSSDEEQLIRLMKILKEQIYERKKLLAEYSGNPDLYEKATGQSLSAIITIIDNYAAFNELYENLVDELAYLSREGSKYKIYFIITATAVNEVKYKISQNFGKQYVLQMNDKSDYSSVFGNVKGVYPSKLIGRGLILKNSVYEFQTAHICKDEELQAYVTGLISELNANYSDDNVIKVPEVPEKLTPEDIKITQTLENVQVGVDLDLVKPVVVNLKKSVVNVITGKNIDEVIATGRGIAELVSRIDNCEVTILDSETEESKIVEIYNMMVERNNSYKDDNTLTFDRKVIFIMNWQSIIDNLSTDGKDKLECLIKHCELEYSVTFVLCDIAESVKKYNRSNWYVMRADSSDYVWVGVGIDEQSVFNNPINYREVKKVKKDNAVVVSSDEYIIIKPVRQYEKAKGV